MGYRGGFFIAVVLPLLAFLFLAGLGTWQVYRLNWKQGVIEQIAYNNKLEPLAFKSPKELNTDHIYRRVSLAGEFIHDSEIHLFTGSHKKVRGSGYNIFTPLILDTGGVILVDRGWVPHDLKKAANRLESLVSGKVIIDGMLVAGEGQATFTPDNDIEKNIWFWLDINSIVAIAKLELPMFDVRATAMGLGGDLDYPIMADGEVAIRNDHLQYAITWYALAIALLVIYVLVFLKRNV